MADTFDIRIQLRRDSSANWELENPILKIGELAFAIDSGVCTRVKLGIGVTWNNTPTLLTPLKRIQTTTGRNLDLPNKPYNKTWDLSDINVMMNEIFNPYSAPTIGISTDAIPLQEVGDTYTQADKNFNIGIGNASSIKVEGSLKYIYIDDVGRQLVDQVSTGAVNELVTKSVSANKNTPGLVQILKVHVLRSDNSSQVVATYNVEFRLRSGFFLWKNNDPLFAKTDSEISSILHSIENGISGVRDSSINSNGAKPNGTVNFNTANVPSGDPSATGGNGFFDIYVYNPVANGTPIIFNPSAGASNKQETESKDFSYTNGTASTSYRLTKTISSDKIVGTYSATIQ